MLRFLWLTVLTLSLLAACSSSSASPRPTNSPAGVLAHPCDITPPASGASVIDLRTLQPVQSISCLGRVPLGLINATRMQSADAWFDRFFAGDDLPQSATLHLSIVLDARIETAIGGSTGASYQWWFYTGPQTGAFTATAGHDAEIKLAVRFADGAWGVFADTGQGWLSVPLSSFQFGNHEISAVVPVDHEWGMTRHSTTFFRAVTSSTDGLYTVAGPAGGQIGTDVGDLCPRDATWRKVFDY